MGFNIGQGFGGGSGGSSIPADSTYTNPTPMAADFRGFSAGDTFSSTPHNDIITKILYPYQSPVFSSFAITGQTSPLEVGNVITSGNKTFTWTTTNASNINVNSIKIIDVTNANTDLATSLANDGNELINIATPIQKVTATNHTFRIQAINTNSIVFNRDYIVNWQWRFYWGFLPNTSLVDSDLLLLQSSKLTTSRAGSIVLPANPGTNYDFICYPSVFGNITSIIDNTNSFNATADYINQGIVSHTNQYGVVSDYIVYRSVNPSGGKSGWNYSIS
jgi:hypothetical protein